LARAPATPQSLSLRARIVLRAADIAPPTNRQSGRDLGCPNRTVGKWRRRFVARGFSGLQDAARSGRPRTIVSSMRVQVIAVASAWPKEQDRPVTRWTFDAIGATGLDALPPHTLSRSSVWRLLHDSAVKPHTSADWLHSHDEHCDAKARAICQRDVQALEAYQHGHLVICCDEKTGLQVLARTAPTKPAQPGRRERRAHADIRRGPRVLINALAVATGHRAWTLGATRQTADCVAHRKPGSHSVPPLLHSAWMMDHLQTHWSLDGCR
jgi:hypothetical protein